MVLEDLRAMRETLWLNPGIRPASEGLASAPVTALRLPICSRDED